MGLWSIFFIGAGMGAALVFTTVVPWVWKTRYSDGWHDRGIATVNARKARQVKRQRAQQQQEPLSVLDKLDGLDTRSRREE